MQSIPRPQCSFAGVWVWKRLPGTTSSTHGSISWSVLFHSQEFPKCRPTNVAFSLRNSCAWSIGQPFTKPVNVSFIYCCLHPFPRGMHMGEFNPKPVPSLSLSGWVLFLPQIKSEAPQLRRTMSDRKRCCL